MLVQNNLEVTIEYKIYSSSRELIDSSLENNPFTYLHGVGQMMPGIEEAISNKGVGFEYKGSIPPHKAYGEYNVENVFPVPREQFSLVADQLEKDKRYDFNLGSEIKTMTVVDIDDKTIVLDSNHIYAGEEIYFECKIIRINKTDNIQNIKRKSCSGSCCSGCLSSNDTQKKGCHCK